MEPAITGYEAPDHNELPGHTWRVASGRGTRAPGMTAAGWPGVRRGRRAARWGKKTYAGSLAEDVWRRLDTMDFINRGMTFAATLLLCCSRPHRG